MGEFGEYFRSVGDVWLVWLATVVGLTLLLGRAFRKCPWEGWRRFHADECGASYALPYVLTFPIYLLVACLMIQATMILMVKMGTVYAAYCAARSAIVWRSASPDGESSGLELAKTYAQRAAVNAMAPFASGYPPHRRRMFPFSEANFNHYLAGLAYQSNYERIASDSRAQNGNERVAFMLDPAALAPGRYVINKYRFAAAATQVDIDGNSSNWNQDLRVHVQYEMPMHIPGAGRILGRWYNSQRFYSRFIESEAVLPSESPHTDTLPHPVPRLGIGYDADRL